MDSNSTIYGYWRIFMWSSAALLLALPSLAMQFFPGSGVQWSGGDFAVMGVMLLVACGMVEIGARMSGNLLYRAGVIVAVGIGFLTAWVNLAVGMIRGEGNAANLLFLGVLAIAAFGALAARFAARGMARTMLAAGIAQALIALYVAAAGLDDLHIATLIGLFALPWLLSAGLFHAAGRQMLAR